MPDKKLTDNEIIKALECCGLGVCKAQCFGYLMSGTNDCTTQLAKSALDLINRQQAEIERLKKRLDMTRRTSLERRTQNLRKDELMIKMAAELKTAKSEAYKWFAERLKERIMDAIEQSYNHPDGENYFITDVYKDIANLLKETEDENNG